MGAEHLRVFASIQVSGSNDNALEREDTLTSSKAGTDLVVRVFPSICTLNLIQIVVSCD